MSDPKDTRYLIGNYEVAMQLTTARTIKITGVIYSDDTQDQVNHRLDAAQDVLDRQFVRADVFNKEAQITADYENLRLIKEQGEALTAKKAELAAVGKRLQTVERDRVDQFEQNVKAISGRIDSLKAAVAAARVKLNGAAPPA